MLKNSYRIYVHKMSTPSQTRSVLVLPTLLDQPILLILFLRPQTPLGRLVNLIVLGLVAFLLGLVHTCRQMLCRAVHGDEFQRLVSLGDKLMLRPRGYDNHIASLDLLLLARNGRQAATRSEEQDLIDRVDLISCNVG